LVHEVNSAPEDVVAADLEMVATLGDLVPELHRVRAPSLIRVGDLDRNTPPAWSEEVARALPRARLEVIPGVGHMQLLQDFEGTATSVERFLTSGGVDDGDGSRHE
jgi:pimeloyl-ACP methyl ester carboxylesterase